MSKSKICSFSGENLPIVPYPKMQRRKRSLSKTSSATVLGCNDDLLMEILIFLPAKSLIRFKSVSKHWLSLISSHHFSHRHTLHHHMRLHLIPQQSFLLCSRLYRYFVCDLTTRRFIPYHFRFNRVTIRQSCNGLLLLQSNRRNPDFDYCIYNPTTMQYRILSPPRKSYSGLCLIFDPSVSPHYTVVCILVGRSYIHAHPERVSPGFLVYHSGKHEWEEQDTVPYNFWHQSYFSNGYYFERAGNSPKHYIGDIPTPPIIICPGRKRELTLESHGYLHYLRLCIAPRKNRLHAYEMKELSDDWSEKYSMLDFNPVFASSNKNADIELLGFIRGKTINDSIMLFHVPGKIMIYRFRDNVFEVVVDLTRENYFPGIDHGLNFIRLAGL